MNFSSEKFVINKLRETGSKPMGKTPTPPSEMAWHKLLIIMKKTIIVMVAGLAFAGAANAQNTWTDWSGYSNNASFTATNGATLNRVVGNSFSGSSTVANLIQKAAGETLGGTVNGFSVNIPEFPTDTQYDITWGTGVLQEATKAYLWIDNIFGNPANNASSVTITFFDENDNAINAAFASNYYTLLNVGQPLSSFSGSSVIGASANGIDGSLIAVRPTTTTGYSGISRVRVNFNPGSNITSNSDVIRLGISEVAAVPEPSSTALLGLGALSLLIRRKR